MQKEYSTPELEVIVFETATQVMDITGSFTDPDPFKGGRQSSDAPNSWSSEPEIF